jgi:four helix bundle protein
MKSETKKSITVEKSFSFSLKIVRFYRDFKKQGGEALILGRQLLRSSTSIGANIHEAQAAQSKADFIHKISISHKEAWETLYWLKLILESELSSPSKIQNLIADCNELLKIISSILLTSKNGKTSHSSLINWLYENRRD